MTPARARAARSRLALGGVLGLVAAVVAGCGSGDDGTPAPSTPVTSAAPTTSAATPTTTAPSTGAAPSTTAPAPSTPPPATTTAPTTTAPSTAPAACRDLDVAVTRVPGGAGVSYGLITVTNRGTSACALPGVPRVRLLGADRAPVTAVAAAIAGTDGTVVAPGASASTLLQDRSATCSADTRSAFVEVTATGVAAAVVAPLTLPPCALSVRPFTPGTEPAP